MDFGIQLAKQTRVLVVMQKKSDANFVDILHALNIMDKGLCDELKLGAAPANGDSGGRHDAGVAEFVPCPPLETVDSYAIERYAEVRLNRKSLAKPLGTQCVGVDAKGVPITLEDAIKLSFFRTDPCFMELVVGRCISEMDKQRVLDPNSGIPMLSADDLWMHPKFMLPVSPDHRSSPDHHRYPASYHRSGPEHQRYPNTTHPDDDHHPGEVWLADIMKDHDHVKNVCYQVNQPLYQNMQIIQSAISALVASGATPSTIGPHGPTVAIKLKLQSRTHVMGRIVKPYRLQHEQLSATRFLTEQFYSLLADSDPNLLNIGSLPINIPSHLEWWMPLYPQGPTFNPTRELTQQAAEQEAEHVATSEMERELREKVELQIELCQVEPDVPNIIEGNKSVTQPDTLTNT